MLYHIDQTRFAGFCTAMFSLVAGIANVDTTSTEFQYTRCHWQDLICMQLESGDFVTRDAFVGASDWPRGPYSILTPNEGCPESINKGWRQGYLSFTWKEPYTLIAISECDDDTFRGQTEDVEGREYINAQNTSMCARHVSADTWPESQSSLLGPFHKYAFRLNFCYKTDIMTDIDDAELWPRGAYSIFGDGKSCPSGFNRSEKALTLPSISSWSAGGFSPKFTIHVTDAGNATTVTLTTCDRLEDEYHPNHLGLNLTEDSFIFIMNDKSSSCPRINDTAFVNEKLELWRDKLGDDQPIRLFEICYYRPNSWSQEFHPFLYDMDSLFPSTYVHEYQVLYPVYIYGEKTTTFENNPFTVPSILSSAYDKQSIPWLLIDLGRNIIITGIQFKNYRLKQVNSRKYMGTRTTTIYGYECQRWDEHYPHVHSMTRNKLFPDETVSDAENYCRNPDENDTMIWCYTQNPYIRWRYCANEVYRYRQEDRPFSTCFVGIDRWTMDDFGAVKCVYTTHFDRDILYYHFLKELEGRFVKLVGYIGTRVSKFNSLAEKVGLVKKDVCDLLANSVGPDQTARMRRLVWAHTGRIGPKIPEDEDSACMSDMGMGDETILDFQITSSSLESQTILVRPFHSGWCSEPHDKTAFIKIDMLRDTALEGITIFNWEYVHGEFINGSYTKRFTPFGSKKIMVTLCSNGNVGNFGNCINKTFSLDTFLPVEQPQTFVFSPVFARYVTVRILEPMIENANCLRFELHGCRDNGNSGSKYPYLIDVIAASVQSQTYIFSTTNLQNVTRASVISSIGFPAVYAAGTSLTWVIDMSEGEFIKLIFTNISLNTYDFDEQPICQDRIEFMPAAHKREAVFVDQSFNDLVSYIETSLSYIALAFTTCRHTSRLQQSGSGFRAIITTQDIPSCFAPTVPGLELRCTWPSMYITSTSRFNLPVSNTPDSWTIHVIKKWIWLEIIYFNVRCDLGSVLNITDRFSGEKSFCNLFAPPTAVTSASDTVYITFAKGQPDAANSIRRRSAGEGVKVRYRTVDKSMRHLINFEERHVLALRRLEGTKTVWDLFRDIDGTPLQGVNLAYKGCSVRFGKCYYIYTGTLPSWNKAGEECWIRKSRLVTIHSDEEHELIKYMLRNFKYLDIGFLSVSTTFSSDIVDPTYFAHIGLRRATAAGNRNEFVWEDDSPITFSAWNENEPSSIGDCTRMSFHLFNTNNTWEVESCDNGQAVHFICERTITPGLFNASQTPLLPYTGTQSVTLGGTRCQRWDSMSPWGYTVELTYDKFPENKRSLAENYCRDTEQSGLPWCFTDSEEIIWELCSKTESKTADIIPRLYNGRLSKTSSGKTCQRWDSQTPHRHLHTIYRHFPDATLDEAANYCRDPDNDDALWCFTTDPNTRWETCNFIDTASDRCYSTYSPYIGQWNKTRTGKACQRWDSQIPHAHEIYTDSQFPDGSVANASNFCRDPNQEGFLWCYTMDPATKSEPCVFEYKYQLEDAESANDIINETFQCGDGGIIPKRYVCNGISNCFDITDEKNCTDAVQVLMGNATVSIEVPPTENMYRLFQCKSKVWVSMLARCDGIIDCIDGTDEFNCSYTRDSGLATCPMNKHACDNGECVHISQMCDFIADCTDASDENCDYPLCSSGEYRCENKQCIPNMKRCDAFKDCHDGTDESGCEICNGNTFRCDRTRCIPRRLVCDKYVDCDDESDEVACDQSMYYSCEERWLSGYRESGIYMISDIEVECNFDDVNNGGYIYTIFRNFEVSSRGNEEVIKFLNRHTEFNETVDSSARNIFLDERYICEQNITQSCISAHKAAADYEDRDYKSTYKHCLCLVMVVNPGFSNYSGIFQCGGNISVNDTDRLFFNYEASEDESMIVLNEHFHSGVEITFGPAVCKFVDMFDHSDVGCGDEEQVFPASVRCVYDTDPAGFNIGCRSMQHLQGCESYQCPENTAKCPGNFCLPLKFLCDGVNQCPGGQDEQDCGCEDEEREIALLYEDVSDDENLKIETLARRLHTRRSIIRTLRFRVRIVHGERDFEQSIFDISDTEIKPSSVINRQFTCNYSVLVSDFINSIYFSKTVTRGVIYLQHKNGDDGIANMMFTNLKSKPDFLLYRVTEDAVVLDPKPEVSFPFVQSLFVKSLSTLSTVGEMFFPGLCNEAAKMHCPNGYKCAASKTCIPLEQVCDGYMQCIYGDDERSCDFSCPDKCVCVEYTSDCSLANIDNTTIDVLNDKSRALDLSSNPGLQDTLVYTNWQFPYLISLNLSNCSIKEISQNIFQALANLQILDLSFNKFPTLPGYAFIGLRNLVYLNMFGNSEVLNIESYAFSGLSRIKKLEINGATIGTLSAQAFAGLHLDELKLLHNTIVDIADHTFSDLDVKVLDMEKNDITIFNKDLFRGVSGVTYLYAPAYKYCCVRPNFLAEEDCFPQKNELSSCDDLLRFSALQTMLWLIGIMALIGNVFSILFRLVYDRESSKLGYGVFVTNLAVADFLMGVYLIIIAIADATFRKRYIFMDSMWRGSAWCTLAGVLSTVSSEASVFFLCLITLDRLLVIKYPFGQVRFDMKKTKMASLVAWSVAVSIGLIPVLHSAYFHGRFYSKSGICIALPLTRDRPHGWLYSIIIFVGMNFVTFCLVAVGQIAIYFELKNRKSDILSQGNRKIWRGQELKVARNLLLVVATDFLCWFPIGCMGLMSLSGHVVSGDVYAWTAVFVLPVNSALNPVLYTLTAIQRKKKPPPQTGQIAFSQPRKHIQSGSKQVALNGLFRYFITPKDSLNTTFVCLNDLQKNNVEIRPADIATISLQLMRCVCVLHKHSLVIGQLDGNVIYTRVMYGKIVGDVQLRHEPTASNSSELKAEDLYRFAQVLRYLLVWSNKQLLRNL